MDELRTLLFKLRRLLRSRGRTVDDTDDLIQEAFLRLQLYCRDHAVEKKEAFLVRTALNLSTDQARRDQRAPLQQGLLEEIVLIDPYPSPDEVYASQKRLLRWKQGVAALSPRRREVFLLNRVEGYSFPQIADRLGITLSMVEKHAAKAVLFLTDWMDQETDQEK
ncbi:MAG TPA: sigma-70 family RNA polymerase sigma factor [Steroidobacter sp.]|uniref:RNA polymerase sigma factor n=1 Tax=Steroidobacter sp. TaxID=1978227 RepID=UPI002EDB9439